MVELNTSTTTLSQSYTIQPKSGLAAGTYSTDVIVTGFWSALDSSPSSVKTTVTFTVIAPSGPSFVPIPDWRDEFIPPQYVMSANDSKDQKAKEAACVVTASVAAVLVSILALSTFSAPGVGSAGLGLTRGNPLGPDPSGINAGEPSDEDPPILRIKYDIGNGSAPAPQSYWGSAGDVVDVENYYGMWLEHVFVGWSRSDTGKMVRPGDTILAPIVPITLTAVWEEV